MQQRWRQYKTPKPRICPIDDVRRNRARAWIPYSVRVLDFQIILVKLPFQVSYPFQTAGRHPSKTILVKPPSSSNAQGFASSWSAPHTNLIQITSLILIPLHTVPSGGEDHCSSYFSHIIHVSSSLPLMSWSTKTLMLDFLGNFVVRGHLVGWRAGGVYSVGFN